MTLANEKTSLLDLWEQRRILYEQCMDLQLFLRDTEQADAWMTKQEVHLCHVKQDVPVLCQFKVVYGTC